MLRGRSGEWPIISAAIVKAATAAESGELGERTAMSSAPKSQNLQGDHLAHSDRTSRPPPSSGGARMWRHGVIGGWEGSHFDLREGTPPGASTPRGKQMRLEATSDVVSVLREIEILDLACERAVFAARVESGRIFLKLNDEELEELAEHLAAEANHEPNRRREKCLGRRVHAADPWRGRRPRVEREIWATGTFGMEFAGFRRPHRRVAGGSTTQIFGIEMLWTW